MILVAFVISLLVLQFFVFGLLVGKARMDFGVSAPATSGHDIFDRYFRVHQNTLEQLICVIPSMIIFGMYVHPQISAALGLMFFIGRIVYLRGYVQDPAKRSVGFGIGALAGIVLMLGSVVGAGMAAFS